jgi:hypothetical protein
MPTVKEQAAAARAAGLREFICDRPCRKGHVLRRADGKATCVACNYLRNSAHIPNHGSHDPLSAVAWRGSEPRA